LITGGIDMPVILGVDPGVNGAIAYLFYPNREIRLLDIPSIAIKKSGRSRKISKIDVRSLVQSLAFLKKTDTRIAYIEDVHSMPKQGVSSSFTFGETKGILIGVLAALGCSYRLVSPNIWKKHFALSSDKKDVLFRARSLYPDLNITRPDQAEAIFILEYGIQQSLKENPSMLLPYQGRE